jgi:hypothetical protein
VRDGEYLVTQRQHSVDPLSEESYEHEVAPFGTPYRDQVVDQQRELQTVGLASPIDETCVIRMRPRGGEHQQDVAGGGKIREAAVKNPWGRRTGGLVLTKMSHELERKSYYPTRQRA